VFASGGGTTFQALLDHVGAAAAPTWTVDLLVSDRPDVVALERAVTAGVPAVVVSDRGRGPAEVAAETLRALRDHETQAVCLAGYLRLVPADVVAAFDHRMLNVHPALLPAFGGKGMYGDRVHQAVLDSGALVSGPTVHLVDAEYDHGTPIAQWPVPVLPGDAIGDLRNRVQVAERALYPLVVDHLAGAIMRGGAPRPLSLCRGAFARADQVSVTGAPTAVVRDIMTHAFNEEEN